jgi:glycosyltransferase involved in cell wall biosynthesis
MKTEPYLPPLPVPAALLPLQVSVVIPVYNEVESVPHLLEAIAQVLLTEGFAYEIIAVDDGSTDGTTALLKRLAQERQDLRAVLLRRNYGQTAAMAAGFHHAKAPIIVTLDGSYSPS